MELLSPEIIYSRFDGGLLIKTGIFFKKNRFYIIYIYNYINITNPFFIIIVINKITLFNTFHLFIYKSFNSYILTI